MMNLVAAELYFILLNQNALIVSKGIKNIYIYILYCITLLQHLFSCLFLVLLNSIARIGWAFLSQIIRLAQKSSFYFL